MENPILSNETDLVWDESYESSQSVPSLSLLLITNRRNENSDNVSYNMEHISPLNDKKTNIIRDDKITIIKNNLGHHSTEHALSKLMLASKKFNSLAYWTEIQIVERIKFNSTNSMSTGLKTLPKTGLVQKTKSQFWSYSDQDQTERVYKKYIVKGDTPRDYFSPKTIDSEQKAQKKRIEQTDVIFHTDLSQQGSIPTLFMPMASNLAKNGINTVVTSTIIKTIYTLHQSQVHIDQTLFRLRGLESFSNWKRNKHEIKDINVLGTSEGFADTKKIDTEKYTHFFVPSGKERIFARLGFLLSMYKTPFYLPNNANKKQTILTINNYKDSVSEKTFIWYTEDGSSMSSEISKMDSLWTLNDIEFEEVVSLYKRLIPHRKSCQVADQLIFSTCFLTYGEETLEGNFVKQMPYQTLPIYIGLLEINQPQTFGYHPNTISLPELMSLQIIKLSQLKALIPLTALSLKQTILNKQNFYFETSNKTVDITVPNTISSMFKGSWQSDKIWDVFYTNPDSSVFNMFYPNLLKKLFDTTYPAFKDQFIDDKFVYKTKFMFSIFSTMKPLDINPYTLAFYKGISLKIKRDNNSIFVKSDTDTIDLLYNTISNDSSPTLKNDERIIDISETVFSSELKDTSDTYFFDNKYSYEVISKLNDVTVTFTQQPVLANCFIDSNVKANDLGTSTLKTVPFVFNPTSYDITNKPRTSSWKSKPKQGITDLIGKCGSFTQNEEILTELIALLLKLKKELTSIGADYECFADFKKKVLTIIGIFEQNEEIKEIKAKLLSIGIKVLFIKMDLGIDNDQEGEDNSPDDDEDDVDDE